MKAKWKSFNDSTDLPFLIIESGPSISEIYANSKHLLQGLGVLIIAIDGPTILDSKDRQMMTEQLKLAEIPFQINGSFIWIARSEKDRLFDKTDFGTAGDTCLFIAEDNLTFDLRSVPRMAGILKNYLSNELLKVFKKANHRTVYITNDLPDMLIVSKDIEYLDFVDKQIEVVP
jgi:hypothetical protein